MLTLVVYSRFTTPARVRGPRGGWCGSGPATSRPVVPPGFEPDQVEGGRGVGVLQACLVQAPVAGAAHPGDGHALADGALDAGAQRVSGREVLVVRGGAGGELGLAGLLCMHGELAASGLGSGAPFAGRARPAVVGGESDHDGGGAALGHWIPCAAGAA